MTDDKIKVHIKLLEDKKSIYYDLNTNVTPGSLTFFLDALKFAAKCRSFVVYTYPIGFKILDSDASALFAQTQYFLEYSLEKFDKYLQTKGIESLVEQNEFGVCLSKKFSEIKAELLNIQVKLGEQFKNAKKEFADYLI